MTLEKLKLLTTDQYTSLLRTVSGPLDFWAAIESDPERLLFVNHLVVLNTGFEEYHVNFGTQEFSHFYRAEIVVYHDRDEQALVSIVERLAGDLGGVFENKKEASGLRTLCIGKLSPDHISTCLTYYGIVHCLLTRGKPYVFDV